MLAYTNASTLVNDEFKGPEDLAGFFSGWDPETATYNPDDVGLQGRSARRPGRHARAPDPGVQRAHGLRDDRGPVERDESLEDPRTVFRQLMKHYARYTPEMVEEVCGISQEDFLRVADTLIANSGRERTTAFCYAVGWTQHAAGVQMIRAAAVLQLLLGNMGRPGGGILALRGHASIQGSTDIPTLYDLLPGYLPMPKGREGEYDLATYVKSNGSDKGWWANFDKYIVSLLKAYFGDAATEENDYGFGRLPKITGNHSHIPTMLRALDGGLDGLFVMGQNPAVGSQHAGLQRRALAKLKWLVVRDLSELETANFWRDAPEVRSGELRTEDIQTEVFLMPAASHIEKDGHFTNTQRLLQFHDKALDPPGDARSELWFMHHLWKRVRAHYAGSEAERDWPIVNLKWDYPEHGEIAEPDAEAVLKEINGYDVATGDPVPGFAQLKADGSTACGCWIYSGCFKDGVNQTRRRDPGEHRRPRGRLGLARVGVGVAGQPPHPLQPRLGRPRGQAVVGAQEVRLVGRGGRTSGPATTSPTSRSTSRPDYRPDDDAEGHGRDRRRRPVHHDGRRQGLAVLARGPARRALPGALRALESPVQNLLYPEIGLQPGGAELEPAGQPEAATGDPRYPLVATTFRLTEHHTAGGDEPQPAVARRAAAGDVRRDRPDRSPPTAGSRTAAGW